MIKSFFAATALLVATASTAAAGPYVNLERNDGFVAADDSEINGWGGAATELHLGYEASWVPCPSISRGDLLICRATEWSLRLNSQERWAEASRSPMTLALIGKLIPDR